METHATKQVHRRANRAVAGTGPTGKLGGGGMPRPRHYANDVLSVAEEVRPRVHEGRAAIAGDPRGESEAQADRGEHAAREASSAHALMAASQAMGIIG